MKRDYEIQMNAKELEKITEDWSKPIVKGTLIGFKGLGDENRITAAYPVWRVIGNEIQFVLFYSFEEGRPCIDNTWFTSDVYINKEPIIVDIEIVNPQLFSDRVISLFTN